MFNTIITAETEGINGFKVIVESDISKGLPGISIVGLPNTAIKESKERIRSAITNSFYNYPITKKIVINLSPADIKKEGSHYDLPMALSIMRDNTKFNETLINKTAFLGELSLDGSLNRINGCTALILGLIKDENIDNIIIPYENESEASMIPDKNIYLAKNLKDVVDFLQDKKTLPQVSEENICKEAKFNLDFKDIKGSLIAKRGAEIAAAGFHNLLMIGPPGTGKTMIASRLNTIMPKLNEEEYIEVSKIYSFLGKIPDEIINRNRPFRSPHHTITYPSLIGGGHKIIPGEVVLAHCGVLFMDEFLNFDKKIIQGLRQPIEDKEVTISRVNSKLTYPSDFILLAGTNPCPCGNFLNPLKECTCSERSIHNYLKKASGPILDRIDIFVETTPIPYEDLTSKSEEEDSATIRKRVQKAIDIQKERFKKCKINYNSQMNTKQLEKYCNMSPDAKNLLKLFFKAAKLTARSYHRVLKVSRTIADLDNEDQIKQSHISEAINYRKVFSKYWERI